jgi:hypothetical protein
VHGHLLLFVTTLSFIGITQMAKLALGTVLAADHLPEESAGLAISLVMHHRAQAPGLWCHQICE